MHIVQPAEKPTHKPGGTFSSLGTLPRVPIPDLADTQTRFEHWCTPLLTPAELSETQAAIRAFFAPDGPAEILNRELHAYNERAEVYSWLDEFWPARYLGRRVPVSVNANFFFTLVDQDGTQLQRAANLIAATVRYKQQLDEEDLPVSKLRDQPLCMSQNKYLFSSTRIPGEQRDQARTPYSEAQPGPSQARHIVVIHQRQLFRLTVIDADNQACTPEQLAQALGAIQQASQAAADGESVGYLTTLPRTDWAGTYQAMRASPVNAEALDTVEQALFCVCLDDAAPEDLQDASDRLLHGDGGNRWFDKSLSLIVFSNGVAGVNVEHCGLDGMTVVELIDFVHNPETHKAMTQSAAQPAPPTFAPLTWALNDDLRATVRDAQSAFQRLADNTATLSFSFDDFGVQHIKTLGVSPDAFCQIAFQLAHQRTKGLIGATYESIATRQFERGRTEAMRVVTPEIVAFVDAMADASTSEAERRECFYAAAEQHIQRVRACQGGQAPEQHLWQLQLIAQEKGAALGIDEDFALFHSPGWLKMRDDYLSTSSAPSENATVFGFGATSEQCIGTAYMVRRSAIKAYLSTPRAVAQHMQAFAEHLSDVFRELSQLLQPGERNE
ncbi:MAG TPA: carnitine O-acetyltransferase [Gammaproteobacteria bacterium]|nr:carnitine O-acetyltransferase [Gammaproteobacteria bacterium]